MSRRYFRHGELPLVLLALLAEQPRHGYEVMAELTRMFGPAYRSSPGSVYPAMEALRAEQLLDGEVDGGRTVYSVTPTGREALETRAAELASLELRTGVRFGTDEGLGALLARFTARLMPLANRVDPFAVAAILDLAALDIEQSQAPWSEDRTRHRRSTRRYPTRETRR